MTVGEFEKIPEKTESLAKAVVDAAFSVHKGARSGVA